MSFLLILPLWLSNELLWNINKLKQGLWCTIWLYIWRYEGIQYEKHVYKKHPYNSVHLYNSHNFIQFYNA